MQEDQASYQGRSEFSQAEPKKLRVRCPQCFHLFHIKAHEIVEPRPKFGCTKCGTKFWLPFPEALKQDELIGFPVTWLEKADFKNSETSFGGQHTVARPRQGGGQVAKENCPNCDFANPKLTPECQKCGVVFKKIEARRQDELEGVESTPQLRELWQKVIADFENEDQHEEFLFQCHRLNCMAFAAKRYTCLEEAIGTDATIHEMKGKILEYCEADLKSESTKAETKTEAKKTKRKPSLLRKEWLRASNLCLLLAGAVMAAGYMVPEGRNLIGVGAALGFMTLAARISFRR